MENRDIIIGILQHSLSKDPSVGPSPQAIADAILQKIEFNRPITDWTSRMPPAILRKLADEIEVKSVLMENELGFLDKGEKLFANFINGKITAYSEILDIIKDTK